MIHDVAARLTEVLAAPPGPLMASGSIATRQPAAAGDLPAVAISVEVERAEELGFGRLVRGPNLLTNGTARDDLRGDRIAGTVAFEIWTSAAAQTGTLSRALDTKLRTVRGTLRERGFASLRPASLQAMESVRQQAGGSAFNAWRQRLAYRFVFEDLDVPEVTDSGLITRVDVDVREPDEQVDLIEWRESFSAP